jgi:cell division protein FtsX
MAIRDKFRNVYQCWKKVPQNEWFKTFSVSLVFVSVFACILDMIQFSNLIKISSEIVEASNCVVPMLLHDSFAN